MPRFDAATAVKVDPLDYDFTTLQRADGTPYEGKGIVPEPSEELRTQAVESLVAASREVAEQLGTSVEELATIDETSEEGRAKLLGLLSRAKGIKISEVTQRVQSAQLDAVVELCQGTPTREQVVALPWRHHEAFCGWVLQSLLDPTSQTPDTKR